MHLVLLSKNKKIQALLYIACIAISFILYSIYYIAPFSNDNINYHKVLSDYIAINDNISNPLTLITKSTNNNIAKLEYHFTSQIWPKNTDAQTWTHHLNIYIPETISSNTALFWINGGTSIEPNSPDQRKLAAYFTPNTIDFAHIAKSTQSIVIELQDIPNQFITLDNKQYAEDALIAHTWNKFLKNPNKYKYYSAYLPMVKSVIKAMDYSQNIVSKIKLQNSHIKINDFILSGMSKRGLTTWLTALHDNRVKAMIPVIIDAINFEANLKHIHSSIGDWPVAMHDYYEQNVIQQLDSKNIKPLMQINDPLQYIKCPDCTDELKEFYNKRATIDKYLILASGDDFFTPDSVLLYLNNLPGNNYLRYIPNSSHMVDNNIISNAVLSFYKKIINKQPIPTVKSVITKDLRNKTKFNLKLESDNKPSKVTLYIATNKFTRDFRFANGIKYKKITLAPDNYNQDVFNKTQKYSYKITLDKPIHGWSASFVELEFNNKNTGSNSKEVTFKLTTPVSILPMNYPNIIKNKLKTKMKNLAQYGKKVVYP